MNLDINYVRKQFPSLDKEWVFMDNAGGSQILKSVVDNIREYLINSNVQLGASYDISKLAEERVNEAVKMVSELINANDKSEIILGSSTTMLIRILSICLGRTFNKGDEIIVTNCDHEANIGAWDDLEKIGINIKIWKINKDSFQMETEELKKLLSEKTKLVAVTHTSNVLGTLNNIKEISKVVHEHNALICVDGVAHAPHRLIDVQDTDVDFYAFSFYKVYGPHIAMLFGKKNILENIPGINHYFIGPKEIPYKFQPGNVNYELSYGLFGLKNYFNSLAEYHNHKSKSFRENAAFSFDLFSKHEETLSNKLFDYLNSKKNVKIIGENTSDKTKRVPTVSFYVENRKSDSITKEVDKYKIGIRYGDFYALRLIKYLGLSELNGIVRVSIVHYNTVEEVEKLINALDKIIK